MEKISLQTKNTTYEMAISEIGHLLHLYYGPKAQHETEYRLQYYDRGFSGNPYYYDKTYSLDVLPQEYPTYGNGDYRDTAFNLQTESGAIGCDLKYVTHRFYDGKYSLDGLPAVYANEEDAGYTLEVELADPTIGLEVLLRYGVLPEKDVITRSAVIKNNSEENMKLIRALSSSIDFLHGDYELIHFHGRHNMERILQREPLTRSVTSIGSRRGNSSHQHNPFVIITEKDTNEDYGSCWGMTLLYSGNFKFQGFKDQFGLTRTMLGIQDDMFNYPLAPGETFETPEVAMIYSNDGLEDLSHKYHRLIQNNIIRSQREDKRCPVLINNWEATQFNFSGKQLLEIAETAKNLGLEMFVLDDGWFGSRNSENAGLGDWVVNTEKLGCSLTDFVEKINAIGLKFGIWIEPEMVNEDSELYREHPDWVFSIPGRKPVKGRDQLVLDFSRPEVVDHIFDQISKVIDSANIEYIKMDMNRSLYDIYSSGMSEQSFGRTMHEYVKGVYRFLEMLINRYPHILIEGCSGGGGRFDAGMLYYTPQIWGSDNTDAIDRIQIQYGTSFGYPITSIGSHVSAVPNQQTGRTVPFSTRAVVAQAGSFGYELDLNDISPQEQEEVKKQVETYKRFWPLINDGKYYRLNSPNETEEIASWMFTAEDQSEALLSSVTLQTHGNALVNYVKLRGLNPSGTYKIEQLLPEKEEGFYADGSVLMHSGIPIPILPGEYNAWQWHLEQVSDAESEVEK